MKVVTLIDPLLNLKINESISYDFMYPLSKLDSSLDDYLTERIQNYLFLYSNSSTNFYKARQFDLEKINTNTTLADIDAYRLEASIDYENKTYKIIEIFIKRDNKI
jgi:hypothetical protein